MTNAKLFKVNIGDRDSDGTTFVVSANDWDNDRYYVHTDRHDYDMDAFSDVRPAAVIELPEPEKSLLGDTWSPKGSSGRGIRIAEAQLDDLIAVGALAMAVKLKLTETPTLAQDLTAVLTNARSIDPKLIDAVARLRIANTAKKITFAE
ncbi:hypothetical protein NONI108955_21240 [Nocardia ninae]|uniref:Uncharacterized protein n=1 Tax=Nocardia ninae NBRC 108245 TaxID=1210091 RepID=A0A511MA26_9NOCA|nr:hypothetical protein [Nocardia ninae]GEM37480.1 hypothetical protein NN4_19990 [Nocardia ninae NBRC 108245]